MMATGNSILLLLILFVAVASASPPPPSLFPSFQKSRTPTIYLYPSSLLSTILSSLGFDSLSAAAANLFLPTPVTVFAPTDSSLRTCPSCSLPLLLQEHSISGLYSLNFLQSLAFGTKMETSAPNRCLTVTASPLNDSKIVFVNGVEITKPDLFNNGLVIIHGIRGYVSHLSPISCRIETMTSLSFPSLPPPVAEFWLMRLMLKEAMMRLRVDGYSLLALAMRVKYPDLSDLKFLTVFAIGDESIFAGDSGPAYLSNIMFHIIPNSILAGSDLMSLPKGTVLPTMDRGEKLMVTTAGDGGPLVPMRINFVKIRKFDMVHNKRIVVHVVSEPFRHLNSWEEEYTGSWSYAKNSGVQVTTSPVESMALRKFT